MDINVLMRRSGLKAAGEESAELAKDLEDILKVLEQIPEPDKLIDNSQMVHATLHKDEPYQEEAEHPFVQEILQNAKSVENGMFKIAK